MARVNGELNNFTGGEISPKLRRRSDLPGFATSNEYQENFISEPHGEMTLREGTTFGCTAIRGTGAIKLIPFTYSETENYFLEFSYNSDTFLSSMRVIFSNGTPSVIDTEDILGVEKRIDEVVFHINATTVGNWATTIPVHIGDDTIGTATQLTTSGYQQHNFESVYPKAVNVSAFGGANREIVFDAIGNTAVAAVAANADAKMYAEYKITTGYNFLDIDFLQSVQNFNTLYVVSGSGSTEMQTFTRTSVARFTAANPNTVDGLGAAIFQAAGKFPTCIAIHESRLWLAGTDEEPASTNYGKNIVYGSDTFDFLTFGYNNGTPTAATGVFFRLSDAADEITHLVSTKDFLYIQNLNSAYSLSATSGGNNPITNTDVNVRKIHDVGVKQSQPVITVNDDLFFTQRSGDSLRILDYNFDRNKYIPADISRAAEHLAGFKIKDLWYVQGKTDRIYVVTENGEGLVITYDVLTNTNAWSRYVPGDGGSNGSRLSQADIGRMPRLLSVCSIPSDSEEETVLMAVQRGVNQDTIFIEIKNSEAVYVQEESYFTGDVTLDTKLKEGELKEVQLNSHYLDCAKKVTTSSNAFFATYDLTFANGGALGATTATSSTGQFVAGDVGRRILGKRSMRTSLVSELPAFGVATITAYNSATNVDVTIEEAFEVAPSASNYYFETASTGTDVNTYGFAAGDTVAVVADGADLGDYLIPAGGALNIPFAFSVLYFGYRYKGFVKSINIQGGSNIGPSDTHEKNVSKLGVKFRQTNSCKIGTDPYCLEEVIFSSDGDDLNCPTPLFNGEKIIRFDENWDTEKHIYIMKDDHGPCTIQAISPYMETSNE